MGNELHNFLPAFTDQEGPQPGPSWDPRRGWLDALGPPPTAQAPI
jgi:2-oxoglutarate dehydrogenase E1 component